MNPIYKMLVACFLVVGLVLAYGCWWFNAAFATSYTRFRFHAPVGTSFADFVVESNPFGRISDQTLFVSDGGQQVARFARDGVAIEKVFWSQDGSVVAVRSDRNPANKVAFVAAYDFREHKTLLPGDTRSSDEPDAREKESLAFDARIVRLLRTRGGAFPKTIGTGEILLAGEPIPAPR